ncbi:P22 phage major capsid protein family protein, partial [Arthrospira platensis SPKY1]|nr:P22 phage major capsid protein family protein [Arthrospira platensis SPKY1]
LNNMTNGNTVVAGEVFTIANVRAWDNRKNQLVTPARPQQFTVVTGGTVSGGAVTLRIFPAIIVPNVGSSEIQQQNTAHATVDAAPASGAAVTFLGAAGATMAPRLLVQKQAAVVSTAQLPMPKSDTAVRRSLRSIPLSVRMWEWSDGATGAHSVRFDVALSVNIRDRRRLVRLNGA